METLEYTLESEQQFWDGKFAIALSQMSLLLIVFESQSLTT
jgi:hypothetical protein